MEGKIDDQVQGFLDFVNASPSAFHAVQSAKERLLAQGFMQLKENEEWKLKAGQKYFFTRNHSSLFAFVVGGKYEPGNGINISAAHTDSPNLKIKPVSIRESKGFLQVGVETYGGGLWHTWFDRDLTVAGRVVVATGEDKFEHRLVRIKRPILRVPNLAIHLTPADERSAFKINTQTHLGFPVLATSIKNTLNKPTDAKPAHQPLLLQLLADELGVEPGQIRDLELSVCDTQPACVGGALNEFIFSPRLDNLMMSYCCLTGFLEASTPESVANDTRIRLVALFDNEEIGSESAHGAASNLMPQTIERILACSGLDKSVDAVQRAYRQSFLISADMAHSVHPNYPEKHEENHQPAMQKGVAIKYNANQRYATTSITAFLLKELARRHSVPIQEFVVRNDSPCGSTIGPILSAGCGIRTIDIGLPQLAMHSIREMCGADDVSHAVNLLKAFYSDFTKLDESLVVD
jgi:aspartyl aminopeptidase